MSQLDTSPGVNHLLKSVPQLIERPADSDWGERCDEAVSLLRSNKVLLAQDKFESLRRTVTSEPAILSGLLHCAIWRGDLDRQTEMAKQLSEVESLDEFTRTRYRAISGLLSPIDVLSVNSQTVRIEFDDVEQAEMALIASDRTVQFSAQRLSQVQIPEGEVRPRSAFFISDQVIDTDAEAPSAADSPATLGIAMVFGRQTDQEPQVVAYDITEDRVEAVSSVLKAAIPTGKVALDDPQPIPMTFALDDRPAVQIQPKSMSEMARHNRDFANSHDGKRACELPLPILGGKSLAEVADDDSLAFERASVVRVLEGQERMISLPDALSDVYSISKIDRPSTLTPTEKHCRNFRLPTFSE